MCSKMQIKEKQGGRYDFGAPERLRYVKMHDCTLIILLYYVLGSIGILPCLFALKSFGVLAFVCVSLLLDYSISMR